jgi:hypothetical protein
LERQLIPIQEDNDVNRSLMALVAAILLVTAMSGEALAVSQAGAISLTFPIGARYNALGEAGTAHSTDITAMWWNVGGFAFAADNGKRHGFHFMNSKLVPDLADDVTLNHLGYGHYFDGWGMLGAYVTYLNNGEQTNTDEGGTEQGTFNSYEFAVGLAYGVKLSQGLGLGVGVKYFRNELAPDSVTQDRGEGTGSTWAIDAGLHWRLTQRLWFGTQLSNLGPDITFIDADQSDPMPLSLRVGLSYDIYKSEYMGFMILGDYLNSLVSQDETQIFGVGLEWNYAQSLYVRLGYKDDKEGEISDSTWGLGVDLTRWTGQSITVDYASVPQAKDLDRVNRISVGFLF